MEIRDILSAPRDVFEKYCKDQSRFAYLGEGRGIARVLGKYNMYVPTRDTAIAPHLIMDGYWEPWVTTALFRLPRNIQCIDIGANLGYYTLLLADLCGNVRAFEPQRELVQFILNSVKVNGLLDRVQVSPGAVSDWDGTAGLSFLGGSTDLGSVSIVEGRGVDNPIPVRTLDGLRKKIDFIKMDAEGSEEQIWKGGQKLIEAQRPTILMEFTPHAYEEAPGFLERIQAWYPLREVDTDGGLKSVTPDEILSRDSFSMLWLEK